MVASCRFHCTIAVGMLLEKEQPKLDYSKTSKRRNPSSQSLEQKDYMVGRSWVCAQEAA